MYLTFIWCLCISTPIYKKVVCTSCQDTTDHYWDKLLVYCASAITFLTCFQVYFFKDQLKAHEELDQSVQKIYQFLRSKFRSKIPDAVLDLSPGRYTTYLKKNDLTHDGRECAICLVEFKDDDKVKTPKCSNLHVFHKKCLGKKIKVCPMCRAKI